MKVWQSHTAAGILYVTVAGTVMAAFLVVGTYRGRGEGHGRKGRREAILRRGVGMALEEYVSARDASRRFCYLPQ